MRRFALAFTLFAFSVRADDDAEKRQKVVDKVAEHMKRIKTAPVDERKVREGEVKDTLDRWGSTWAGASGALVIASTDGSAALIVGGTCEKDGVSVVVAAPPKGLPVRLRGGDGGETGKAGRSAAWRDGAYSGESGGNGEGERGGRGGSFAVSAAGASASGATGANGKKAEAGREDDLPDADSVKSIAESTDALQAVWDNEDKRKALLIALAGHRPARGAVACWSKDGKLLVLIGANGDDRNPDGVSVEVAGKPAERIVAIAGNPGMNGKPGAAKAPEGSVTVNGK